MFTLSFSVSPSEIYDDVKKLLDLAGVRGILNWSAPSVVFLDHRNLKVYTEIIQSGKKPPRVIIVITNRVDPSKEDLELINVLRNSGVQRVSFIDPENKQALATTLRYFLLPLAI